MKNPSLIEEQREEKCSTILVAVDFSSYSVTALRKAKSMMRETTVKILALHVIDEDFVKNCVRNSLGELGVVREDTPQGTVWKYKE